jgi:PAS domain S-box-containing protein
MTPTQRAALRELLRRADEVRGMADRSEVPAGADPEDGDALLLMLHDVVEELERSHRRLIETNVQLVSLREVASSMAANLDHAETTRTVTRYLSRAFGFDEVFLLLINRESGRLEGTWTHGERAGITDPSETLELPLLGDHGTITRCLWLDRTLVHHAPRQHPPALLPDGHPLQETLQTLGSTACVPLPRSHATPRDPGREERCGGGCIVGEAGLLVPPPGPSAERWAAEREEAQQRCLRCDGLPLMGVIGIARPAAAPPLSATEVTLLESIALSVAPVVENARLYQELRRSERFRDHVLDSMASALVAVNLKGEILTFNRAAEQLLGVHEAEVLGQPFGLLFGLEGEAALAAALEHGREARREETLLRARDGTPRPVSLTTSLLRNERRGVYGAIATFMDLTPLKRAEEHARRLDRLAALGRFTSSVAHEIRNPLTGIAAGVQYLARTMPAAGAERENLDFLLSEIRRLDRIVQDLFDITHPRQLRLEPLPLEDTLRRAAQSVQALATERRVTLAIEADPRTPPVPHDADQMQQVLINLLKNAIEASPAGASVRARLAAPPPRPPRRPGSRAARAVAMGAVVRVSDDGPGISSDHLKTIFEPFFTTKPGGTGLGLYISHDIVKRHGGSLTVTSESSRGTTFTVELPAEHSGGES